MKTIRKSKKLNNVCYDIRGPVLKLAEKLEEEGYQILKLNIGNPAPFGYNAPDEILHDIIINLPNAQGYCQSKGLFSARKAVMQDFQSRGIMDVDIEDIFIGNGASELISMSMHGLLNTGDEVLVPAPDYPLWTASITLSGGTAVHYRCDEESSWYPDLEDIRSKITDKTVGIVVINPNNPTGAVYPREILEGIIKIAEEKQLLVFADEIYEKIVFDNNIHVPLASLSQEIPVLSYSGLSKAYRAAGFRGGWMVISGNKKMISDYIEGLNILSNMRLCSNVPVQWAIQTALGGYQSIKDLVLPGGRLLQQRDFCYQALNDIPGISAVKPGGALYFFPKIDTKKFNIKDDERFIMDLLQEKKILLVHGRGFNWPDPDHFRLVFLPKLDDLEKAMAEFRDFLLNYKQE